jgi:hypothetical protein
VPLRIRATSPIYCGRCGKRHGLMHTCIVRRPGGRTRLKAPAVQLATCTNCGKSYVNPLTHVCPSKRGDFKRRKRAAERRRQRAETERRKAEAAERRKRSRTSQPQHRYETCKDDGCQRLACRAYKEGYANGFDDGRAAGYQAGHADGYAEGYADGAAKAPTAAR